MDPAKLVKGLRSPNEIERAFFVRALHRMEPARAVELLVMVLKKEAKKRLRFFWLITCLFAIIVSYDMALILHRNTISFTGLWPLVQCLLAFISYFAYSTTQKNAYRLLTEIHDLQAVGPLAEALSCLEIRGVVEEALCRLLPCMKATDAGLLDDRQRECLYRHLGKKEAFTLVLLAALEQIGTEAAIPYVEKLTHGPYKAEIQRAARACLPVLGERIARERAAQTLLRPSSAPEDPAGTLLRPAQGPGHGDADLLLRPIGTDE